jgi:hypothetical protein
MSECTRPPRRVSLDAIIVFLIGFILGTISVLLLAPCLGETTAVIPEPPMILAASRFVCCWCVDRLDPASVLLMLGSANGESSSDSPLEQTGFEPLVPCEKGTGALGPVVLDPLAFSTRESIIVALGPKVRIRFAPAESHANSH